MPTDVPHYPRGRPLAALLLAVLTALVALIAAPRPASAVGDPSLDYKTLTTPHFRVHYEQRLEAFARRTARVAEEAHTLLLPLLEHEPTSRTHIVVNDKVDTANGSATTFGRKTIRVFAMPPEPDGVLGFYNDWLRILVFHEYVHILHLDTAGGVIEWFNDIFGNLLKPNALLPRWYVEGLAVLYESKLTGTGRNNSSLFRMWLRTAALEGTFFSLGTVSGNPISWPQGTTPYLYGGFFFEYIDQKHGSEVASKFNRRYGRRVVPFGLNKTLEEITGETFHELWDEWTVATRAEALARHVAVEARGRTPLEFVTDGGGRHRHPRTRPGTNQVSFFSNGLDSHAEFAVTHTSNLEQTRLFEVAGAGGDSSWTPDGDRLVYSRTTVHDNVYSYKDLYVWNAATDNHHRLTDQKRASHPAVSPEGDRIAYVRTEPGTVDLVVCRLDRLELADCRTVAGGTLWPGDDQRHWQQISRPVWSPDADTLVFSRWRLDLGQRDLWAYDFEAPAGRRLRQLTDDDAQDTAPHFGPDGLLYWSADRTGIYNIYARRLAEPADGAGEQTEAKTWQLSNVETGLFQPWVSSDGHWIYASAYTEEGYEIARFPRPSRLWTPAPTSYQNADHPPYPEVDTSEWEQGEYKLFKWLNPLFLKPNLGVFTSGSGVGGTVRGRDPIGDHSYALSATLLTGEHLLDTRGSIGLTYDWRGGPLNVNLAASLQDNPRNRAYVAESRFIPFIERRYAARVGLTYPLRQIDNLLSFSTSFNLERTLFRNEPNVEPEPGDIEPREPSFGWFNRLDFSMNYANLDRYPQSVSIERGISGNLTLSVENELLGSETDTVFLSYGLRLYHPNPLVDRHVFRLKLNGGIARSGSGGSRAFAIGGYRPQDVLSDVILQNPRGQFVLRGYPPGLLVGSQFQTWTGSYRFPLLRLETGPSTVPVYLNRLKGEVFFDAGGAFNGLLSDADLRTSVGLQLQLGLSFGYYLGGNLRLGYARGLGDGGINEWFLLYGGGF